MTDMPFLDKQLKLLIRNRKNVQVVYVFKQGNLYPTNILRNAGLSRAKTPFVFVLDADF